MKSLDGSRFRVADSAILALRPSPGYAPKAPTQGVLYQIVRDHVETFRAEAARAHDGHGLPRFIEEQFRGFLRCGLLAGGFARFRCAG